LTGKSKFEFVFLGGQSENVADQDKYNQGNGTFHVDLDGVWMFLVGVSLKLAQSCSRAGRTEQLPEFSLMN
jgi:hypothetical protein